MRVLISAYACEPGEGSEPGAGWAWARAAAENHEVWVVTRRNNAERIEAALATAPIQGFNVVYVDLPPSLRFWKRGRRGLHAYYLLWQLLARRVARRMHAQAPFDVAHHVTFAVDWMPAGVVGIRGLPSIWGPVGGATAAPISLWRWLGVRGVVAEIAREAVTRPLRRTFGDRNARHAQVTIAQNRDVARRFGTSHIEPHPAVDELRRDSEAVHAPARRRAVFVGRLVPWKGARLAVAALAETNSADWELHVYGDGPDRAGVARAIRRAGVSDRVVIHGHRPRHEILRTVAAADCLLFPSMHDSAPWAVAEAVAAGTPVVCLDRGGPPVIAGDAGHAVPAWGKHTPGALAAKMATCGARLPPSDRWSQHRLPRLLDRWYLLAIRGTADQGPVTLRRPSRSRGRSA